MNYSKFSWSKSWYNYVKQRKNIKNVEVFQTSRVKEKTKRQKNINQEWKHTDTRARTRTHARTHAYTRGHTHKQIICKKEITKKATKEDQSTKI